MTELTKQQEFDRGVKAQALIESDLLQQAFREIEEGIFDQIKASKPQEQAERERLYQAIGLTSQVYAILRSYLGTGQIAASAIAKMKRKD